MHKYTHTHTLVCKCVASTLQPCLGLLKWCLDFINKQISYRKRLHQVAGCNELRLQQVQRHQRQLNFSSPLQILFYLPTHWHFSVLKPMPLLPLPLLLALFRSVAILSYIGHIVCASLAVACSAM